MRHPPVAPRHTPRLLLRQPVATDRAATVALFARPEMVAHRPHPEPDSPEASAVRLEREMAHWQQHGFGRWAVERDGAVIGFGGLTVKPEFEGLNISYHLHPDAWRQGYASELAREALAVAFGPLQARRVIGLVRRSNPASLRVLQRLGFEEEREVIYGGGPTLLLTRGVDSLPGRDAGGP